MPGDAIGGVGKNGGHERKQAYSTIWRRVVMVGRKREARLCPDVPAIHIFVASEVKDADARHKAGHDAESWAPSG